MVLGVVVKMKIEVLGTGCPKCKELEKITTDALKELKINEKVIKVTDIDEIINHGVMGTPALVIDGKVIVSGRILDKNDLINEIKKVLK